MASNHWQRVQELFDVASRLPPEERAGFLERRCGEDVVLRQELESLLRSDQASSGFIADAVAGVAASMVSEQPPDAAPSLLGRRIGAYEVTGELGHGGMGAVYSAVRADDAFRKEVAIKLIRRGADLPEVRRRFLAERQILASFDHPNVARLQQPGAAAARERGTDRPPSPSNAKPWP